MRVFRLFAFGVAATALLTGCGGGDDDGSGGGAARDPAAEQLQSLADKAEADAITAGAFRNTGFLTVCRQATGYAGTVFEQIGFSPTGEAAKHEYCYNVSDDRKAVGLSVRSPKDGKGLCIVSRLEGGKATRSPAKALGDTGGCFP